MITPEAFYKISYGLYVVCSGDRSKGNGFISNTIFQVSSEPAMFAACCNKDNITAGFITRTKVFSVSVLHQDASPDIIGRFGFKSGRTTDKMEGMKIKYGETGVPIVLNDCIAYFECRVEQVVDAGTHLVFIGIVEASELLDESKVPLTYLYYRQVRKGFAPKNAPTYIDREKLSIKKSTAPFKKFRCPACGYIYDEAAEGKRFGDLPSEWICPVCGTEKSEFIEV